MSETDATDTQSQIRVSRAQLPLSCPNAETDPAALHPRVYIPLEKRGDTQACPYCGARYLLID